MTYADAIHLGSVSSIGKLRPDRRHRSPSSASEEDCEDQTAGQHMPKKISLSNHPHLHAVQFGRFRLMLHSRELLADGKPVSIGNRALDVLAEHRNSIRTVSGRGYRFVAEITAEYRPSHLASGFSALDQSAAVIGQVRTLSDLSDLSSPTADIIGREDNLKDLGAMVAANRLVTLVGTGGIGKTRLAIELSRRLLPTFANGVRVAELGRVSDPSLVVPTIASALELDNDTNSLEQIVASLNSKHLLLVLDNCEHVIEAATNVTESLLQANAALHIIATSREPLKAAGEWVYRVPALEVPPEDVRCLQDVLSHSAAKLFIERVRAAEPSLLLDGRMAAATATICRRLDGIPLAIELAAARAVAFGVEGLASTLDERLSLLADGRRTSPARHRTLRATFDWNYELLSEPERAVMRRLGAFVGDFSMESAILAAGAGELDSSDVIRHLANLVTKSLIVANVSGPSPRYKLLGTVRAFAAEKLKQSGEFDAVTYRNTRLSADLPKRTKHLLDMQLNDCSP